MRAGECERTPGRLIDMAALRIGVITSSDSCAAGEKQDGSGPALVELIEERGWELAGYRLCADDAAALAAAIVELADVEHADVVFTTGGTGFSPRDVAPEATMSVCDRMAPGIAEYIRAESTKVTPRAILSRGVAALRGRTLVINVPGSVKAARESFGFVAGQLEHAVEMIAGGGHA
jgi:molybdenum cofactor synthesis domain-containing protein